jgi:hypothetical protein
MNFRTTLSIGVLLSFALLGGAVPALAQTMRVQTAGGFDDTAPTTPFSRPGARYTLSFTLDRRPALFDVPDAYRIDHHTTPLFDDFEYRLDGELLPDASFVFLYSASQLGGMELVFGGIPVGTPYGYNSLFFIGAAYYSGNERNPVIEAGLYPTANADGPGVGIAFEGRSYFQPATEVTIGVVPVPPSAALMLAGLLAVAAWRRSAR